MKPPEKNHHNIDEDSSSSSSNDHASSLEREKWCINQDLYKFHGFWFTKTYLESTKRMLQHFKPHPKDVILASFPKTGTTWLKALLHSIIHRSSNRNSRLMFTHPHYLVPSLETYIYLEESNIDHSLNQIDCKASNEGKILSTHLPYQFLRNFQNQSDCKIVYVTRNPKDALNSLWHFLQTSELFQQDPWELSSAVDQFLKGVIPFGPYYDHVLSYKHESRENPKKLFFVTYEELKEDPKKHVVRMAEFLECPFDEESEAEGIVEMCKFEKLSEYEVNKSNDVPKEFPLPRNSFFRKGEVGDYENYMGDYLVGRINSVTKEKFHGVGFEYGI